MDPIISPTSSATNQPSPCQNIIAIQQSPCQDIVAMQPQSPCQDIVAMQPSPSQDTCLTKTNSPVHAITDLNSISSDDEVTIVSVRKVELQKGPLIKVESSDEEEHLDKKDLSTAVKIHESMDKKKSDKEPTRCHSPKEQTCSICLGEFDNKSFLDQCFHAFCFYCILQWSEVVTTCPLCKARFSQIIHSVKSMTEYEVHKLPPNPNTSKAANSEGRRFRYRTTVVGGRTVSHHRNSAAASTNAWEERERRRERMLSMRRRKVVKAKEKRRSIYAKNLWVQTVTQTGRPKFRETSPQFFRSNPACTHRLVPWLTRELQCLLNDEPSHVDFVLQLIMTIITKIHIDSDDFMEQLHPFFTDRTEHFVHEFLSYARSPFDMTAYDGRAQYDWPRENNQHVAETPLVVDISATGWDSPDDDTTPNNLASFSSEPGPSGLSVSKDVVSDMSSPIAIPQPRAQDNDDWSNEIVREQTTNQELDQIRNDVIDLSPEEASARVSKKKRRHKHKHKRHHKHKHKSRRSASDNVFEASTPVTNSVKLSPSSDHNSLVEVIVVSSEGTGSPECIEHSSRYLGSTPESRTFKSRSKTREHSKPYRRRSRDSSIEGPEFREDHQDPRDRKVYSKRTSTSRDKVDLSRGHSKSRDHSRHGRSRSRSAESRTEFYSQKKIKQGSKATIETRDIPYNHEQETRPSSPTAEEMKEEILELEKKIAEDSKRLEELIKKQEERNRVVDPRLVTTEESETDGQSR